MAIRKSELPDAHFNTVYFGGGTPSVLEIEEIRALLDTLKSNYKINSAAEVTLEINPDDMSPDYLKGLKSIGINRLSIGVQSFQEADLIFMNRNHDALKALQALALAREVGFESLSADLIYGTPGLSDLQFEANIQILLDYQVDHISAYALTVEPKTALYHQVKTGKVLSPNDDQTCRQFYLLKTTLSEAGFEHYEISNWALPGRYSRHNTAYWQGTPYLGFGPSAHSFDGHSRSWNLAANLPYAKAIEAGQRSFESELLTPLDQYNEKVMTALRTMWGLDLDDLHENFQAHFIKAITPFIDKDWVQQHVDNFTLTDAGQLMANHIASEVFLTQGDLPAH
jgi:oxygen-independent coproporphyrinogen-3 oxidase